VVIICVVVVGSAAVSTLVVVAGNVVVSAAVVVSTETYTQAPVTLENAAEIFSHYFVAIFQDYLGFQRKI